MPTRRKKTTRKKAAKKTAARKRPPAKSKKRGRPKKKVAKKVTKKKVKRVTRKNSDSQYRLLRVYSKLTPKLIEEMSELVKEGLPLDSVWAYLGITTHTGIDWREKGEKFLIEMHSSRGPEFPEDELEAKFCIELARARAAFELEIIREMRDKKAHARWVRNMTILERRFRHSWGRSETIRVDTESMAPDEAYL